MDLTKDLLLAQQSVIGSILIEPSLAGEVLAAVSPGDFTDATLRRVFDSMKTLFNDTGMVDLVALAHSCGPAYVDTLKLCMAMTPTTVNLQLYVEILLEQSRLHRLDAMADKLKSAATIDEASAVLAKMNTLLCSNSAVKVTTMTDGLIGFMERQTSNVEKKYLDWGIPALNRQLYAEGGDFICLGGEPSTGKTALALQMAVVQAKSGLRVGFFSCETSCEKAYDRLMAHIAMLSMPKIKSRSLSDEELATAAELGTGMTTYTLDIIQAAGMSVADIRSFSLGQRYDVIYVDYLQIVASTAKGRYEKVTEISIDFHRMAAKTGVTVVALSQLARKEKADGKNKAPTMASLRESGQIEQDADVIMLLYLKTPDDFSGPRVCKVAKNKEGTRGQVLLDFDGECQTFRQNRFSVITSVPPPDPKPESNTPVFTQVQFVDLPCNDPVPFEPRKEA